MRLSILVSAKLLGNPLTEVAAEDEHKVVVFWVVDWFGIFCGFLFFKH